MIKFWFPTLISYQILDYFKQHNRYLENKALEIQKKFGNNVNTEWACDTYNTLGAYDYTLDSDSVIQEFVQVCKNKVVEFSKEFGVTSQSIECTDFWFNISSYGNYQEFHRHAGSHFSMVYYVTSPANSGDIIFQSAETNTDMFPLPVDQVTDASCKTCVYQPEESALLLFRSNLLHMVKQNKSNRNRISISANFKFI
jgi:uncharacterized protein (TIGR02466 family)